MLCPLSPMSSRTVRRQAPVRSRTECGLSAIPLPRSHQLSSDCGFSRCHVCDGLPDPRSGAVGSALTLLPGAGIKLMWPGWPGTTTVTWVLVGSSELEELRHVADRALSGGGAALVGRGCRDLTT